jgi:hypothetical protein
MNVVLTRNQPAIIRDLPASQAKVGPPFGGNGGLFTQGEFRTVKMPIVCPYCWDSNIELVPNVKLHAQNFPNQTKPLAASVFHCTHWHIFATFPLEDAYAVTQHLHRR